MADVSVLMPVLNAGAHLRPAIDSVLAQRGPSFELLVIDDGSTDGSVELAESFRDPRIVVIRNERRGGLAMALNVGLRRAGGEFAARLDADDLARPGRFARQVDFLRRHPQVALVGSQARLIDAAGTVIGSVGRCRDERSIRWYNLLDNPFIHSSVMFRRGEVVDQCGGYDERLRLCEDWDLWGRILERFGARNLDEALVDYRFSLGSITGAIESSPSHPRRPLFQEIAARLVERHASQLFGSDRVSRDEAALLTGFLLGVDGAALDRFLSLFAGLLTSYERAHPDARRLDDFSLTVARQYDAIAFRVTPPRRRSALRVYAAAAARGARIARFIPWTRALVLIAFGRSGRDRIRQVRNASRIAKVA
jgi:glycosyltransferase involved in cell wall biosynthesis